MASSSGRRPDAVLQQRDSTIPRRFVIPIAQSVLVVVLVIFWALLVPGPCGSPSLSISSDRFGVLLISQFWTLANEVYDARQATALWPDRRRRLPWRRARCVDHRDHDRRVRRQQPSPRQRRHPGLCAGMVLEIVRLPHAGHQLEAMDERGVGGREALRLLAQSKHLRGLAAVVGFAAVGAAMVDQQLSMAADASGIDANAIAVLLAQVTIFLSVAGFVVGVLLTSRIHRSFGIAAALLLLPIGLGASATLILITGQLWAVATARVLDTTLRYSVDKSTREVLFLPLPADLRFRAKPFIDVTMDRFAKAMAAAVLILVLIHPRGLGLDWHQLSYASLFVTAGWVAMALIAWRE